MSEVIALPGIMLPVAGSSALPVRRVFCVGRNYAAHAREMGHDPDREPPFFFNKTADALLCGDGIMPYPPRTSDLHHEVELVVAIGKGGSNIPATEARDHIHSYAVGLDMTRRDLQAEAKGLGRPWEMGKSFDASAPIAPLHRVADVGHIEHGTISLTVNGIQRQSGDLRDMIWSVPEIIAELSTFLALKPGDLILTGTPEGVGPVVRGDELLAHVDGLTDLCIRVA